MLQKACIKIVAHAIDTYLFFLIIQLSLLQNKRLLWSLFFSANVTTLMEELVLVWMTNHVNLITLSSNHCCCRVFLTGGMWGSPLPHIWKFANPPPPPPYSLPLFGNGICGNCGNCYFKRRKFTLQLNQTSYNQQWVVDYKDVFRTISNV